MASVTELIKEKVFVQPPEVRFDDPELGGLFTVYHAEPNKQGMFPIFDSNLISVFKGYKAGVDVLLNFSCCVDYVLPYIQDGVTFFSCITEQGQRLALFEGEYKFFNLHLERPIKFSDFLKEVNLDNNWRLNQLPSDILMVGMDAIYQKQIHNFINTYLKSHRLGDDEIELCTEHRKIRLHECTDKYDTILIDLENRELNIIRKFDPKMDKIILKNSDCDTYKTMVKDDMVLLVGDVDGSDFCQGTVLVSRLREENIIVRDSEFYHEDRLYLLSGEGMNLMDLN